MFKHEMILVINKPTHITKTTATAIELYNIFINSFFNSDIQTGIIEAQNSDLLPISLVLSYYFFSIILKLLLIKREK